MTVPLHCFPYSITRVAAALLHPGDPRLPHALASMHPMLRRLEQGTARSDDASSSVSTRGWTASQPAATPLAVRRLPGPSTPAGLPKAAPTRSGLRVGQLLGKAAKLLLIGTAAAVAAVVVTQVACLSRMAVPMFSGHSLADRDAAVAIAGSMCVCAIPCNRIPGMLCVTAWPDQRLAAVSAMAPGCRVWADPPISGTSDPRLQRL